MRTIAFILLGAAIAALLLLKRCAEPAVVVREVVKSDTVTVVRVDTVIVKKPIPVRVVERRTDTLTVYRGTDTLFVPVPIAQYQFRDSLYALDITGYAVSVDRLEVYPRTTYRTIHTTTERVIKDRRRWALGLQAGYGYNFSAGKPGPYIGIGLQYNLIRW